jgi:hypothetical protein
MINIPLDIGSLPSVDLQVNNARLKNAFVNEKKELQLLPNLLLQTLSEGTRAILKSTYRDRWIIVKFSEVSFYEEGIITFVGNITHSTNPVRLEENLQNQVTIVNKTGAWVFSQQENTFLKLDTSNGFDIAEPADVTVLDTITIVVGGNEWIVSEANNALVWNANEVKEGDTKLGDLTGVRALDNNLFIFGKGGVQRWVPSIERVPNSFPFTQDPTYRDEFGCISTASLLSENNEIFYLSKNGQIRRMTPYGGETITNDGISNIIGQYSDTTGSFGSYYYHKGYYLYQLTFPDTKEAWIYNSVAKKWSESDELIIGFDELAIKDDGIYEFTSDYSDEYHEIVIQTPYMETSSKNMTARSVMNSVILILTQGKSRLSSAQICDLQISKDNVLYGNRSRQKFSSVAKRLRQLRWYMNYTNTGFSLRFTLQLREDITIETAQVTILK